MKLIYDEEQVKKFYNLLPRLEDDEVYFISLSARNKYLTEEERRNIGSLRSEMFGRKIIKEDSFEAFLRTLRSYELKEGWYNNGKLLPDHCLVAYANINTSSGLKALKEFYEKANEILFSLHNKGTLDQLRNMDTLLMNCYQRSRGKRVWIDIDIDSEDKLASESCMKDLVSIYRERDIECHPIATKGGYHILLKKSTIHYNYMKDAMTKDILIRESKFHSEVVQNVNEMVPIPGTIQAGFEVKFIEE
jgi:hypothetical protein